jgi:outer membrane protein TolC
VAVVDATALNSERNALSLLGNRFAASVNLIVALGGGWEGLPAAGAQARADNPVAPAAAPAQP